MNWYPIITTPERKAEVDAGGVCRSPLAKRSERDRMADCKNYFLVLFTGCLCGNPFTKEPIFLFVGDYSLGRLWKLGGGGNVWVFFPFVVW